MNHAPTQTTAALNRTPRLRKDGQPRASTKLKSTPHSLVEQDAAAYIGMSTAYLRQGRMRDYGPAFIRCGRSVRYRRVDLDAWLDRHRVQTRDTRSSQEAETARA